MYYFYFDASALVKRYTNEIGSDAIDFIFENVELQQLRSLLFGAIEVFWILVRKRNDGRITHGQFSHATANLENEVIDTRSDFKTLSVSDSLVLTSIPLIDSHSLNSVDAVVLCSAKRIAADLEKTDDTLVLIASDKRLLKAAQQEGLLVFNPELDSIQTLTNWITHT